MIIRKIDRSPHEPARDVRRAIGKTPAYRDSRRERKKVEMPFAHLKRILKLRQLRLRGPAVPENLRRMAKKPLPIKRNENLVMS
jgi:hypothetical protein